MGRSKPKPNSYEAWAISRAERRQAEGKRIVLFGDDIELDPAQVNKLQRREDS
jgi:hypothetical protein